MKRICFTLMVIISMLACQRELHAPAGPPVNDSLPLPVLPTTIKWQKITHDMGGIENLVFLSPAKGFCAAARGLFSSIDSGKTWRLVSSGSAAVNDIFFYDAKLGYYVGDGGTGYTTDGGNTWIRRPIVTSFRLPHRIFFGTPGIGYVTSENGLFKTIDSGKAWKLVQAGVIGPGLYFSDADHGFITAIGSVIYKTPDGCITFPINKPSSDNTPRDFFTTIQFTDNWHGWVNNTANNYIFRTVDAGGTWQKTAIGKLSFEIDFINNNTGYIATGDGVAASTDGGVSWKQILQLSAADVIHETFFLDEKTGWAADAVNSSLYRTVP